MAVASNEDTGSRPLPIWVSIPIILLCLGGGGFLIHYYVISDPVSHDLKVLGEPAKPVAVPTQNRNNNNPFTNFFGGNNTGGMRNRRNVVPHAISLNPQNDRWEIKTETATAIYFKDNKGQFNLRLLYNNTDSFLPQAVKSTLSNTSALTNQKDLHRAKAINLSDEQIRSLQRLSNSPDMAASTVDRESLKAQFSTFIKTADKDRAGLEPNLYKTLDEVAQRSIANTIESATNRANEINRIVTPDLWKQSAAQK